MSKKSQNVTFSKTKTMYQNTATVAFPVDMSFVQTHSSLILSHPDWFSSISRFTGYQNDLFSSISRFLAYQNDLCSSISRIPGKKMKFGIQNRLFSLFTGCRLCRRPLRHSMTWCVDGWLDFYWFSLIFRCCLLICMFFHIFSLMFRVF